MVLFIAQGVISDITDCTTSPKIVGSVAAVPPTPTPISGPRRAASTASRRTASTSAAKVQNLSAALADTPRRPVGEGGTEKIKARRTLATDATFATPMVVHQVPKQVRVRLTGIPSTARTPAPPTPTPPTPTPTKTPPPSTSASTTATLRAVSAALEARAEAAKAALGEAAAICAEEKSADAASPTKSAGRLSRARTLSVTTDEGVVIPQLLHRVNTTATPDNINKAPAAAAANNIKATAAAAAAAADNIKAAAAAAESDTMATLDESAYHTMDTDDNIQTTVDRTARISYDFLTLPKVCKILTNIPCSNKCLTIY